MKFDEIKNKNGTWMVYFTWNHVRRFVRIKGKPCDIKPFLSAQFYKSKNFRFKKSTIG